MIHIWRVPSVGVAPALSGLLRLVVGDHVAVVTQFA
jgi:hypothetical protein